MRFLLALLLALSTVALAEPPALEVAGALPKTGPITLTELKAIGSTKATWTAHGQKHEVEGVALDVVLTRLGFDPGPMGKDVPKHQKRAGWRKIVIASGADGFQAVFTCAELMPQMGGTRAMLVWSVDGKPLSAEMGPLRIAVLTDQEPSRSLYALRKIAVQDATRLESAIMDSVPP